MEDNLIGTLSMFRTMGIKPNFSDLARSYGKDRHTIRKMYDGEEKKERKKRPSELDTHIDDIVGLLSHPGTSIKGAYWYLRNEKGIKCSYDNFKHFVRKNKLSEKARRGTPHPLYETDPGEQLQVDWVEGIKLATVDGEVIAFNLFSATLGYSRLHSFEYSEFKGEADFKRCLVHFFKKVGGVTKGVLTDNMSAIVSIADSGRRIHPSVAQFFKDLGVKLRLCRVRSPETKGKDEVSNKYAQWLQSYDGKIRDRDHIIRLIEMLNRDINRQKNTGTNIPPILLFGKEKEYLLPLPADRILDSYEDEMRSCKVPSTFVIDYKGAKYSVPPNLISKTVSYKESDGKLHIYRGGELVATHAISGTHTVNYNGDHYKAGLGIRLGDGSEIDGMAGENLARFKDINEIKDLGEEECRTTLS